MRDECDWEQRRREKGLVVRETSLRRLSGNLINVYKYVKVSARGLEPGSAR